MQLTHKAGLALASLTLLGLAANNSAQAAGNPVSLLQPTNSQLRVRKRNTGTYTLIVTNSEEIGGFGFGAEGKLYGLGWMGVDRCLW